MIHLPEKQRGVISRLLEWPRDHYYNAASIEDFLGNKHEIRKVAFPYDRAFVHFPSASYEWLEPERRIETDSGPLHTHSEYFTKRGRLSDLTGQIEVCTQEIGDLGTSEFISKEEIRQLQDGMRLFDPIIVYSPDSDFYLPWLAYYAAQGPPIRDKEIERRVHPSLRPLLQPNL